MVKILSNGTGRRKTSVARVYIREGAPGQGGLPRLPSARQHDDATLIG